MTDAKKAIEKFENIMSRIDPESWSVAFQTESAWEFLSAARSLLAKVEAVEGACREECEHWDKAEDGEKIEHDCKCPACRVWSRVKGAGDE